MIQNNFNTGAEAVALNMEAGINKAKLPLLRMILLGIVAGAFIALGGVASSVAAHGIQDVGLMRTLSGCIFPVGLMMIVFVGGELFTGNCLIIVPVLAKKTTWGQYARNLAVVFFSNLAGALLIDFLIVGSGLLDFSDGLMGASLIKAALSKISISPMRGITSGILCNILVCIAILMATAARDAAGKVWAIFFPILAFVICGFEHCVANMFYIPMGIMASLNPVYAAKAEEAYGITAEQISTLTVTGSLNNFIPVTIGNMLGGALFVGTVCYFLYIRNTKK